MSQTLCTVDVWRTVLGFEGRYEVSDQGQVRSSITGSVLAPYVTGRHHTRVSLPGRKIYVHHLVLEAFVGPRPEGMQALHRNDVVGDNRVENLYWGTDAENSRDSVRNGTHFCAAKTHCKRGHELDGPNLLPDPEGAHRRCRECKRLRQRTRKDA